MRIFLSRQEFDRQESRRVRLMFEEIESMLFEASVGGPAHLYRECRHWNGRFPHMRLLGRQLLPPQDLGFVMLPLKATSQEAASPRQMCDLTSPDTDA